MRKGVKKLLVADCSVHGEGGHSTPCPQKKYFFKRGKDVECSETEKYAKIFCDVFAFFPIFSFRTNKQRKRKNCQNPFQVIIKIKKYKKKKWHGPISH